MRNEYKQSLLDLTRILNEWDFIGVYPFKGGPKDEYNCLIGPIISCLKKGGTESDLNVLLSRQLKEHFGMVSYEQDRISNVTKKIIKWWVNKS